MKLDAVTKDGMGNINVISISSISVWINKSCNQELTEYSLNELLEQYKKSGKMTITKDGKIDAFSDTPLYTNGQESVIRIQDQDYNVIWDRLL